MTHFSHETLLYLGISLKGIEFPNALLNSAFKHECQSIKESKHRVATEPFHPLHRSHLQFHIKIVPRLIQ